jgi:hypothetical protein
MWKTRLQCKGKGRNDKKGERGGKFSILLGPLFYEEK